MKERPILFSGPMVRAILEGRKTQTRRVVKFPIIDRNGTGCEIAGYEINSCLRQGLELCHYGKLGDRLWVKETSCLAPVNFATPDDSCIPDRDGNLRYVSYRADGHSEDAMRDYKLQWTPSIFMPRWASRITLEVTGVRVERLQEISEEDAEAEGVSRWCPFGTCKGTGYLGGDNNCQCADMSPPEIYKELWESINGKGSWDTNPWVWVIEFAQVTK